MEKDKIIKTFKNQFFIAFGMLEKIIEICPYELWNEKHSGFIFWQQLIHILCGINDWLRDEKLETISFSRLNGKNTYPELMEKDPEIILSKTEE